MIDRFGKQRVLRALTKRKFRNKRRTEERKTGQKNFGFKTGGQTMAKRRKRAKQYGNPYADKKKLTEWEKKQKLRKEAQDKGGNIIFADEWEKIDSGLKKGIGLHKGGTPRKVGKVPKKEKKRDFVASWPTLGPEKRKYPKRKQIPVKKEIEKRMREETPLTYGISKFGKTGLLRRHLHKNRIKKELASRPEHLERPKVKLAQGGITGKSKVGDLKRKYGSLKKGIRLKGKGSSFMEEYKKRVYGRAKGGSMVQGPMKRARGSGVAIKGTRFQGTF